jgi:MFS family permease
VACAYLEVSPRYSTLFNTIHNTAGAVAGILGPIIVAALTSAFPGVWGWRFAFILTAGMSALALSFWYVFQTSEVVPKLNNPIKKKS